MQTVGASKQRAPFDRVSSARAWPTLYAAAMSNVAATQLAAGKHAAGVPPLKSAPRAPLGPSDVCKSCQAGLLSENGTRCDCVYLDTGYLIGHFYSLPEVGTSEEGDLGVTSQRRCTNGSQFSKTCLLLESQGLQDSLDVSVAHLDWIQATQ